MKNKNYIWWSRFILEWLIFIAVSKILVANCVSVLMINEINISVKIMTMFGFIFCEYGWVLLIKRFVSGIGKNK